MAEIAQQAGGKGDPDAALQLRAMQVRLLYESWVPFIGNIVNGALVVAVLWPVAPSGAVALWGGLVLAASAVRLLPRHRYLRARPPAEQAPRWGAIYTIGAAVSGSIWGLLALSVHGVDAPIYHAFVGVVIAGMGAGAAATHSSYLPAFFAFLLPSAAPLAVALLTKDLMAYHAMGLMTVLFVGLLTLVSRSMNGTLIENFSLTFDNERLIDQLSGARDSLEMRVRERTGELQRANLDLQKEVAERKRAEDSLREREAQLEQAQQIARIGVFTWDPVLRRCLHCSEELAAMFGVTTREFMASWSTQKDFLEKVHPDDRARFDRISIEADEQVTRYEAEYRTFDSAGNICYWREIGEPVLDETGRHVRTFGTVQDITAIKTAEAALRESEERLRQAQKLEAVGQLTGGVAHDFNNLLAVIMGNAEVLALKLGDENPQAQTIMAAAARGAELTDRLLAFSRKQTLRPRAIDLDDLVGGMADLLRRTLGETIEVKTESPPDLGRALADPGQLENAILNLALNARDAMPAGGVLTIEATNVSLDQAYALAHSGATPGDYVVLATHDTGTGMAPEVLERAFEPFFTTKEVGQGSGLGLSMVYGFARQSDGHVTIESETAQGTTVRLYLPRTELEAERAGPESAAHDLEEPVAKGETVLVVEDDPEVRRLAVALLEDLGYRVLNAPDGRAALGIVEQSPGVDLLLSDVVLPGRMSGPELAREVRNRDPGIKVLFMSGYPETAVRRNGVAESGAELLGKPFRKQELARMVRASLGP